QQRKNPRENKMDASYKIQRGIHVHLIQFFMCPEFWVHIRCGSRFFHLFSGVVGQYRQHRFKINRNSKHNIDEIRMSGG
ncbi:hypothetical protein, partial [Hominenteromicrobium sp.]|uniref:hypothetical protein n=1 Tax=Hominenteromicrobium sp. TaxID=3073581 RepID=UPI003AB6C269